MSLCRHAFTRSFRELNFTRPSLQYPVQRRARGRECLSWLPRGELTNFERRGSSPGRSAPILLISIRDETRTLGNDCSNVTARETRDELHVALLTPTYGRDLELCALLCESVDRHVHSFSKHYLLVPDCDLPLFSHFESEHRMVLPASTFLPRWLRPLPRIIQRKRRQYWWSFRAKPVSGWHVQQFLKIAGDDLAAAPALLHPRFGRRVLPRFRPRALRISESDPASEYARTRSPRAFRATRAGSRPAINFSDCRRRRFRRPTSSATSYSGTSRRRARWPRRSRPSPASTGSKRFAGPAAVFGIHAVRLFRAERRADFPASHTPTSRTPCVSYWDPPQLGKGELNQLLRGADEDDVAFSVASFSGTPVQTIRAAIDGNCRVLRASRFRQTNRPGWPRYADRPGQHQFVRQYPLGIAGAIERIHFHAAVLAARLRHLSSRRRLRVRHQHLSRRLVSQPDPERACAETTAPTFAAS